MILEKRGKGPGTCIHCRTERPLVLRLAFWHRVTERGENYTRSTSEEVRASFCRGCLLKLGDQLDEASPDWDNHTTPEGSPEDAPAADLGNAGLSCATPRNKAFPEPGESGAGVTG